MRAATEDSGGPMRPWDWALIALVFAGSVLLGVAPIAISVEVVGYLPGIAGIRPGLSPLLAWPATVVVAVIIMVAEHPLDRFVARLALGRSARVTTVAQELCGIAFLTILLSPLMSDALSAVVAALLTALLYLATAPLVDRWARRDAQGK